MRKLEIIKFKTIDATAMTGLVDAIKDAQQNGGYLSTPRCNSVTVGIDPASFEVGLSVVWVNDAAHKQAGESSAAGVLFEAVGKLTNAAPSMSFFQEA